MLPKRTVGRAKQQDVQQGRGRKVPLPPRPPQKRKGPWRLNALPMDDGLLGDPTESFYDILGLDCSATSSDIRKAYHSLIRSYHPDRLGPDAAGEVSEELCVLLNEMYETLMDPAKRTAYDELAGFSSSSTNPFVEVSQPCDQVFVDEFACIGCKKCALMCPRTFDLEHDFGRARAVAQGADPDWRLQEAIDACPVSCIHWVTAPQLALLEVAMARMERVPVNLLHLSQASSRSVFTEASLAFEKRYQDIQQRIRAAQGQQQPAGPWGFMGFMSNIVAFEGAFGARAYDRRRQQQQQQQRAQEGPGDGPSSSSSSSSSAAPPINDKEVRGIAQLAAKAARAARTWRSFQDLEQARRRAQLQLAEHSEAAVTVVAGAARQSHSVRSR